MRLDIVCLIIYMVVGMYLANMWFEKEFGEEYKTLSENGKVETGTVSLLLLFMTILWPLKLVYNLVRYRRV
jgi:uncharacterized protein YneF (UPF0154 family)